MGQAIGQTGEVFNEADFPPWGYLTPPFFWKAFGAEVIADRHLPDGTRQHLVRGHVPQGTVVSNAQVFGQDDLN